MFWDLNLKYLKQRHRKIGLVEVLLGLLLVNERGTINKLISRKDIYSQQIIDKWNTWVKYTVLSPLERCCIISTDWKWCTTPQCVNVDLYISFGALQQGLNNRAYPRLHTQSISHLKVLIQKKCFTYIIYQTC